MKFYLFKVAILIFLLPSMADAQKKLPNYYKTDETFNQQLHQIIKEADLDDTYSTVDGPATVSFAVIDLNGDKPVFGGVHYDAYIYPASVYKMYVAMEVLKQISAGHYKLEDQIPMKKAHNIVDSTKEISTDPRPLIRKNDTLTVHYLLDLMLTRSDNTAANELIDLADRSKINKTMIENNWEDSKVTRKYLIREDEDRDYKDAEDTETSALDAADFIYKMYTKSLINPWVSLKLKTYLGGQLDNTRLASGLPNNALFYHKTGWWNMFINDVGLVDDGKIQYVIALFTPLTEDKANPRMQKVSELVYKLIKERHQTK